MITLGLTLAWANYALGVTIPWWLWGSLAVEIIVDRTVKAIKERL